MTPRHLSCAAGRAPPPRTVRPALPMQLQGLPSLAGPAARVATGRSRRGSKGSRSTRWPVSQKRVGSLVPVDVMAETGHDDMMADSYAEKGADHLGDEGMVVGLGRPDTVTVPTTPTSLMRTGKAPPCAANNRGSTPRASSSAVPLTASRRPTR